MTVPLTHASMDHVLTVLIPFIARVRQDIQANVVKLVRFYLYSITYTVCFVNYSDDKSANLIFSYFRSTM